MNEATMAHVETFEELLNRVERSIPHSNVLVGVLGCEGSGVTSFVDGLFGKGYKTFDPRKALIAETGDRFRHASAEVLAGELNRRVRMAYNDARPTPFIVDNFPYIPSQLEFAREMADLYDDQLVVVRVDAPILERVARVGKGKTLSERTQIRKRMTEEDAAMESFFKSVDKLVPWCIHVQNG